MVRKYQMYHHHRGCTHPKLFGLKSSLLVLLHLSRRKEFNQMALRHCPSIHIQHQKLLVKKIKRLMKVKNRKKVWKMKIL